MRVEFRGWRDGEWIFVGELLLGFMRKSPSGRLWEGHTHREMILRPTRKQVVRDLVDRAMRDGLLTRAEE